MKDKENEKIIKEKVQYFFEKKQAVHVRLKNKEFRNGRILEVSALFCVLKDAELGNAPIFFQEIYDIEPYKKEEKDG